MRVAFVALSTLALLAPSAGYAQERDYYVAASFGLTKFNDANYTDVENVPGAVFSGTYLIDNTINYAVALGSRVTDNFLTELELSHRRADASAVENFNITGLSSINPVLTGFDFTLHGGFVDTTAILVNAYYEFQPDTKFKPYLLAGLGYIYNDVEATYTTRLFAGNTAVSTNRIVYYDTNTTLAYQLGFGATYPLSDQTELLMDYRKLVSRSPKVHTTQYDDVSVHEVRVGLRYQF